ncbi:MAG: helix-turn-helix domain-containing protein [Planctomycetota bacterium]
MSKTVSCNDDNFWLAKPVRSKLKRLLGQMLFFIKTMTEYALGMYIGAFIGLCIGWWGGHCYAEHVKPFYLSNSAELTQAVAYCSEMPFEFARNGKLAGAVAGAIAIALINGSLLRWGIISSYESEVRSVKVIARRLGTSEKQVQRKIRKLIRKGIISSDDLEG